MPSFGSILICILSQLWENKYAGTNDSLPANVCQQTVVFSITCCHTKRKIKATEFISKENYSRIHLSKYVHLMFHNIKMPQHKMTFSNINLLLLDMGEKKSSLAEYFKMLYISLLFFSLWQSITFKDFSFITTKHCNI